MQQQKITAEQVCSRRNDGCRRRERTQKEIVFVVKWKGCKTKFSCRILDIFFAEKVKGTEE